MSKELSILIIEDVPADVVLINRELRKGGLSFRSHRIETEQEFVAEIRRERPDIILADHGLPSFDSFSALTIAQKECPEVPFIFVSSAPGEELAVKTLKGGAADYVLKGQLAKLVPAITQALRQSEEKNRRAQLAQSLRENEERLRMLLEGVKDYAIFMLDPEGRITSWNAGAEWIENFRADEILGQPMACLYPSSEAASGKPATDLRIAAEEGRSEEEGWRLRKSGAPFWAKTTLTPLRNPSGKLCGFAVVLQDLTQERQAAETELRSEMNSLCYSIAHDLRAPVRHIDAFVQLLHDEAWDALDARCQCYLVTVADTARHLGRLIDELVDLASIGGAEIQWQPLSLGDLVEEIRQALQSECAGRNVLWTAADLPVVWADPRLLRQALTHLLSNAIQFTRMRREARIEVGAEKSGREWIIHVRDNGIGFDMKYQDKLFGIFQKLHQDQQFKGAGVSLAKVKRIAQRLGGRTWAESSPNHGATFYFTLPRNKGG